MNEVQLIYSRFRLILPMNHVPPLNFDTFTTIVQGDDYQNKADEFLKCIQFDKLSKRDLISLIIIANYPDVVADSSGIDNKSMKSCFACSAMDTNSLLLWLISITANP